MFLSLTIGYDHRETQDLKTHLAPARILGGGGCQTCLKSLSSAPAHSPPVGLVPIGISVKKKKQQQQPNIRPRPKATSCLQPGVAVLPRTRRTQPQL